MLSIMIKWYISVRIRIEPCFWSLPWVEKVSMYIFWYRVFDLRNLRRDLRQAKKAAEILSVPPPKPPEISEYFLADLHPAYTLPSISEPPLAMTAPLHLPVALGQRTGIEDIPRPH